MLGLITERDCRTITADVRREIVESYLIGGQMAHFTTASNVDPTRWLPKEGCTPGQTKDEKRNQHPAG